MRKIPKDRVTELKAYPISFRLQKLRYLSGYTQQQLAAHLGVTNVAVCNWETGKTVPYSRTLEQIILLYDLPSDFFLDIEIEKLKLNKRKD